MEGIQTFKGSWPWPWPWIRPYGIPSCITHRPLPTYQISFKSKKLFVDGRTYGHTEVRTDGHFSPYIIRSTFGSRPKKWKRPLKETVWNTQTHPTTYTSYTNTHKMYKCISYNKASATDAELILNFYVQQTRTWCNKPISMLTNGHTWSSKVIRK